MAEQNLKEKTARGILWGGINNCGQQLLNLVFGIILARLLTPADYGMVGMLTIFSLIATSLQESGFIAGLNRKNDIRQEDYNAVFWFNVFMGTGLYVVLFFSAPLIAAWFKQPLLVPLARLSFLSFVFSSLGTTPRAYLFRNLRVKETAWMSLAALTLSGLTGITLAWNGFAYWGIAIQNLIYCAAMSAMAWVFSGWRPSLHIDLRPLRGMFGFSSKLLLTSIFTILSNNLFSVIFGRLYGERTVGFYNQANKWNYMAHTTLSGTLWNVTQPVFARLTGETERQQRAFRKMLRFTAFVSFPCLFGLALIAPEFITILITDKWIESARIMQLLCVGGAFLPLASFYTNYLVSQGRSNVFMWCTVGLCTAQILALVALHPWGMWPMLFSYVALGILWIPVWHVFVRRLLGISFLQAVLDVAPFALIALASMAAAHAASLLADGTVARIAVKVAVAIAVYVALMLVLRVAIFKESVAFLLSRFRKKKE